MKGRHERTLDVVEISVDSIGTIKGQFPSKRLVKCPNPQALMTRPTKSQRETKYTLHSIDAP